MSKVVRKKHFNIISLLSQATDVVARLINEERLQDCLILLADCQESAVALGGHIEKLYGMETKSVGVLEQYCEGLYQLSVALDEQVQMVEAYENLRKATDDVRKTYEQEFPDKKEVVFLPYKAAMWDSLESVWMAARDDEECEAYVIPIPYYDLDENRNFKEMHYEGDMYPEYVPITHYEDYDLEERHPDMVFIHNPYDEFNTVTSIAPEYYSSKIKDFTEKLVYIPYFVLGEINPENQESIDKMSHFCFLPGILYADQVIVQSENMRTIYINEFLKKAKERGLQTTRKELEKKILGLGSPKFDKVQNTDRDTLKIPEEWNRLIQKEDGTRKKIIFYNTSVVPFLEADEQMIKKIKDVLRIFEENKEEVTLLWRPHPLMKQTVSAMRPELWKEYDKIVQEYRQAGWGIYDDTPEMDIAIAISDAYYGDRSSVVPIYKETGKLIVLQTINEEEMTDYLCYHDAVQKNGDIWFSAINRNGLFKRNIKTGKIEFVCFFPERWIGAVFMHSKIMEYANKIICIPFQTKEIAIYEVDKGILHNVSLEDSEIGTSWSLFYNALQKDDNIYLIPCRSKRMVKFNTIYNTVEYLDVLKSDEYHVWNTDGVFIHKGACFLDEKLYLASFAANFIEEYNIKTGEIDYIDLPVDLNGISHLLHAKDCLWIVGNNGNLSKWDYKRNSWQEISLGVPKNKTYAFFDAVDDGDNIYLTRTLENKLYVYNMVTGFVHIISIGKEEVEKRFPNFWASIASINIFDEVLELSSSVDCSVHQMDINGSVIKREDTFFNLNIIPSMLLKEYLYGQRQIINEINNKTPIEWFKQVENEKNSHEISAYGRNILKVLEGEDEL